MEKDLIFFGEKGITSTSANHISNLCKEWCLNLENFLNNVSFLNEKVCLIGNVNSTQLSEGVTEDVLKDIPEKLKTVAEAKSLTAWLREAVKAKTRLTAELNAISLEEWAKLLDKSLPKPPSKECCLTEDTYLSALSVKERNRYYQLETFCAVIGKYIHPDKSFAIARKELNDKIIHPNKITGQGRDSLIYTYTPTVEANKVEELFFELQKKHREAQAELNSMKFKMESALAIDNTEKQSKYAEEMDKYNGTMSAIYEEFRLWKIKKQKDIQELKIVIPNSLTDIYNKVNMLGKEKE